MQDFMARRVALVAVAVACAITAEIEGPQASTRWEVTVFEEPTPNAFVLTGAKIALPRHPDRRSGAAPHARRDPVPGGRPERRQGP
jgi:hypothetical protein